MIKHNKLKNSGLLFELLVRQMTTDTLNNKDSEAANILKKYFYNTDLLKEYRIYNTIASTRNQTESKALILINACLEAYKRLNKQSIKKQKYNLIAEINSHYNPDEFFKARVDNYKIFSSTYLLLEMSAAEYINEKVYADCKYTILEHVTGKGKNPKSELLEEFSKLRPGTRSMVYKLTVNKFNEKYADLQEDQKALLKECIKNISTPDNLRVYYNGQVKVLKERLDHMINTIDDEVRKVKLEETSKYLVEIAEGKMVEDKDVNLMFQYQELVKEYENVNGPVS